MAYYCFTVSVHNFKSQNFKLSVSNPKSKYVAYLSVLSQSLNRQGLSRKNKHEIVKLTVLKRHAQGAGAGWRPLLAAVPRADRVHGRILVL